MNYSKLGAEQPPATSTFTSNRPLYTAADASGAPRRDIAGPKTHLSSSNIAASTTLKAGHSSGSSSRKGSLSSARASGSHSKLSSAEKLGVGGNHGSTSTASGGRKGSVGSARVSGSPSRLGGEKDGGSSGSVASTGSKARLSRENLAGVKAGGGASSTTDARSEQERNRQTQARVPPRIDTTSSAGAAPAGNQVKIPDRNCYYNTLGVHRNATDEEIKKAYRSKAMEWHPDKNTHRKEVSEHNFKKIGESYEILKDPTRRAVYDRHGFDGPDGKAPTAAPRRPQQFRPARDIFAEFFGGRDPFADFDMMHPFASPISPMFEGFHSPLFGGGMFGGDPFSEHRAFHDRVHGAGFPDARGAVGTNALLGNFFGDGRLRSDPFFASTPTLLGGSGIGGRERGQVGYAGNGVSTSFSFSSGGGGGTRQTTTRIVNGQRTTTMKHTDAYGNVTITEERPDGQKITTVNGVQQPQMVTGTQNAPQALPTSQSGRLESNRRRASKA